MAVAVTGGDARRARAARRTASDPTAAKARNIASMKPKSPMRFVTNAFLPADGVGLAREPERDEQVAAGADALPAEEGDQEVVAQHEAEHREDEQVQVDEELREVLVAVHVADRVQVDQRADAGDEQRHRDRQRVDEEPGVDLRGRRRAATRTARSRRAAPPRARSSRPRKTSTRGDEGAAARAGWRATRPPVRRGAARRRRAARKPASGRAGMSQTRSTRSSTVGPSPSAWPRRRRWRPACGGGGRR